MFGSAKFRVGQVVRHRVYPFRGIIFDIDPVFNNTEEWWQSIPAERAPAQGPAVLSPARRERADRVHRLRLRAEPAARRSGEPLRHPQVGEMFTVEDDGSYRPLFLQQPH